MRLFSQRLVSASRHEGGASAVEFALVAPVFIMFLLGIIELGRALYFASSVQWAVERASRTVAINPAVTQSQLYTSVQQYLGPINNPEITLNLTIDSSGIITVAHVTSQYVHTVEIPFVPSFTITFSDETYIPQYTGG